MLDAKSLVCKTIICMVFSLIVVTTNVAAAEPENSKKSIVDSHHGSLYLGIIAGTTAAIVGEQQLDTTQGISNGCLRYLPTNNYSWAALYGINVGYEFKLESYENNLVSFGIGIYQSSNYAAKGQAWFIYPNSDDALANYAYKLQSTRFMAELQLARQFELKKIKLIPFVTFGIGPALNFANSYQETKVGSTYPLAAGFKTQLNIRFVYQAGVGVACPFNADRDRLSIAYRFVDLGNAHFDSAEGYPLYQLNVGRIRANEIYLGYTHSFNF